MPPYQADKGRAVSMKPPFLNVTAENSEVVVAAKAPKTVQFAACEATNFLSRVFGAPLPVVNVPSDGKVIHLRATDKNRKMYLCGPLNHEPYVLKPNTRYRLSCFLKAKDVVGSGGIYMEMNNGSKNWA